MSRLLALSLISLLAPLGVGCTVTTSDGSGDTSAADGGDPSDTSKDGQDDSGDGDGAGDGDSDGDGDSAAGDGDGDGDGDSGGDGAAPFAGSAVKGKKPEGEPTQTGLKSVGEQSLNTDIAQEGDDGDDVWAVMQDLDGDGKDDEGFIVFDDETGTLYVAYETVLTNWCADGSLTFSNVLEVYYDDDTTDVLLWDSDCPEDAQIVFGCELDGDGSVTDVCGSCAQAEGVWSCTALDASGGDGDSAGDGDAAGDGDGDAPGRCDVPDDVSDLSDADLSDCDLSGADLSERNFSGADLSGADLGGADLSGANLTGAILLGADLSGANLSGANLESALASTATLGGVSWGNTTCPDGSDSDDNGGTCEGHL